MICNVCGNDARCYTLTETGAQIPPFRMEMGMMFNICTDCLTKLIDPIKTDNTQFDSPDDFPELRQHPRLRRMFETRAMLAVEKKIKNG